MMGAHGLLPLRASFAMAVTEASPSRPPLILLLYLFQAGLGGRMEALAEQVHFRHFRVGVSTAAAAARASTAAAAAQVGATLIAGEAAVLQAALAAAVVEAPPL